MTNFKSLPFHLFFLLFFTSINAQLKPGEVSPTAKIIDADEFFNFSDGVARVRKGISWALIDSAGNFIIPYNKYFFDKDSKAHLIAATDIITKKNVLMNTRGKIIVSGGVNFGSADYDGYVSVSINNSNYFINAEGNKIPYVNNIKTSYLNNYTFQENLAAVNYNGKFGFVDRKFNIIIPAKFDYATNFSDGLAIVGKKNEFGEMHYGFIDKKGELVIPFNFSILPHDFSSGLALVEPKENSDFKYAYINKAGTVIVKINKAPSGRDLRIGPYKSGSHDYFHLAIWEDGIGGEPVYIDSLGNIITNSQFQTSLNLSQKVSSPFIPSNAGEVVSYVGNGGCDGLVNLITKKVLPPIYRIQADFSYDPESQKIKTQSCPNNSSDKSIVGYIDTNGVYVIIQKGKSVF